MTDLIPIGLNIFFLILAVLFIKDLNKNNVYLKEHISIKGNVIIIMLFTMLVIAIELMLTTFLPLLSDIFIINASETTINPIILIVSTCMIAPIVEEIIFRFALFEKYRKKFNTVLLIILISIFFSLIHGYGIVGFVIIFILSLLLHLSYLKTNNLINSIIIHTIYNCSNEFILSNITFVPTLINFIVVTIIIICTIFLSFFYFKKEIRNF